MDLEQRDAWIQERYARWLDALTKLAFGITLVAFVLYVSGLASPRIPIADLPQLWGLPLDEYLARTGAPTGWAWVSDILRGESLNQAGLGLFACVVLLCDLAVVAPLARRGERLMAALVAAQAAVLAVAASGVVGG
jgi:hypothetical protein